MVRKYALRYLTQLKIKGRWYDQGWFTEREIASHKKTWGKERVRAIFPGKRVKRFY